MKDSTGRPAAELPGGTADSPIPVGTFVRVTGDEMTGSLSLKPATGDALEVFDASNVLNAFITPAGDMTVTSISGDGTPLTGLVLAADVGAASGVASLDSSGKVPLSQLPAFSLVDVFAVSSQAAMLALSTAGVGDLAVRTDLSETFILSALPASTLGNWVLITPPTGVTSFATRTGAVTPQAGDYDAFNDVRYLQLTGDTLTGPLVIDDPAPTHVPLTMQGAASQTANLTEWKNNAGVVVASVSPTGQGTFTNLVVNGTTTITGNVTFANPNIVINIPNDSSFPTPAVIGVQFGFSNPNAQQGSSSFDARGNVNFKSSTFGVGGSLDHFIPSFFWLSGVSGAQLRFGPAFQDLGYGSVASNLTTFSGTSVRIDPRPFGGSASHPNAPALIVQRVESSQTADIQTWGSEPVGGINGFVAFAGGVTPLSGVRASGNFWQSSNPPAHSTSPGTEGEMAWDATYEYRYSAGAWQRTARSVGSF